VPDDDRIPVRSFRVVFELERRLHKVDRWRVPVPYGVPLRGVAYASLALLAVLLLERLPLAGGLLSLLPAPLRLVILPVGAACLLWRLRIDGRPAHTALGSILRFGLGSKRLSVFGDVPAVGASVTLGELALCPDGRSARYRRGLVSGPASVLLRFPARARPRGKALELEQSSGEPMWRGKRVRLRAGEQLRLR
jgi:hypothetical protein